MNAQKIETANQHVLPDSRLQHRPDFENVMVDWVLLDGTTVRICVCPIHCVNCGKMYGYVPRENTSFVCWLCQPCFDKFGTLTGTYAVPDDAFNEAVVYEMNARFGHTLTAEEIAQKHAQGELGKQLDLLLRASPYPVYRSQE